MSDFLNGLAYILSEYSFTFNFYKKGFFKFLKCLSIIIFIIPATIFSILTLICGFINIALGRLLLVGFIWSFLVCGTLNVIQMLLFWLCNIFELPLYRFALNAYTSLPQY